MKRTDLKERPGFAVLSYARAFSLFNHPKETLLDSVVMVYVPPRPSKYRLFSGEWGFALTHSTAPKQKACNLKIVFRILTVIEKVYVYLPPLAPHRGECARFARALRSSDERLSI